MSQASVTEKTFSVYSRDQSKTYADVRLAYHESVYNTVINHHLATGGQMNTMLDVGCGPGLATRTLAPHFQHATGLDPGTSMIETAQSLGGTTASNEPIRYAISHAAELGTDLDPPVAPNSVDLITAANAAHWFDMPAFWRRAAQVLKPGGSVALWCSGPIRVDPTVPNSARIQAAMDHLQDVLLKDYMVAGNLLVRGLYIDLPLPWTMKPVEAAFSQSNFVRKEWNNGDMYKDERFYAGEPPRSLKVVEAILATSSPVTRWRQANPQDANTERDPVKITVAEIRAALAAAGPGSDENSLRGTPKAVLLIVKKPQTA